jgi:hypothetical protein
VHLTQVAVAAAVTLSITGVSYAALNSKALEDSARKVAAQATCRTVDSAIVAYTGEHGTAPQSVRDLVAYVDGDLGAYRIRQGRAAGPGC